jgi:hypothetical protein
MKNSALEKLLFYYRRLYQGSGILHPGELKHEKQSG